MKKIERPAASEFPDNEPTLSDLIPDDGLLLQHLSQNFARTKELLLSLPERTQLYRYAPGKWTVKEVVMHLIDMERIYMYRALRFARKDGTELAGFDGDAYVLNSRANQRSMNSLVEEFEAVRNATIATVDSFDEEALKQSGRANGATVSVRALVYHIAGHELHHLQLIKDRYL